MNYQGFRKQLESLIADNIHGSSLVCSNLIDLFSKASNELRKSDYGKLVGLLSGWNPPMGNVLNVKAEIEDSLDEPGTNIMADLTIIKDNLEQSMVVTAARAAAEIMKYESIVTISNSGTVAESLITAAKNGWAGTLYIGESRPALEGRNLVTLLTKFYRKCKITFGTDNEIMSRVPYAGAAFVGADLISDSFFVNKTGTGAMAALISEFRKMFVVADLSKYYSVKAEALNFNKYPAREIWPKHPIKIEVVNHYFESIDFKPNIMFINEMAIWGGDSVKKYLDNPDGLL